MLVSLSRPRRLPVFFSSFTSTSTSRPGTGNPQDSIFTAPESPWDHVFSDLEPVSSVSTPAQRIRARLDGGTHADTSASAGVSPGHKPNLIQRGSGVRRQRASITAREMSVFDEMFDLIFDAVSARDASGAGKPSASASARPRTPSIGGRTGTGFNDVFRTLRRHTSRVRWTTAIDEELDRKKETMELLGTDHALLTWVTQEVFGEVERWDEAAMMGSKGKGKEGSSSGSLPHDRSVYPHLIAHAMRLFRTTYANPSLSLAIFNHAARVSIPSYVFGCTAPAYNELMEAKWEGWGDLEGVCNALEEMRANGVKIDGRTRLVVERVRREVGEARAVEESEHANPLARRVWAELGEAEVMKLVHRIEQLALRDRSRKSTRTSPHEESWKSAVLESAEDDGWRFDGWEGGAQKPRRKARARSRAPGMDAGTGPSEEMAFR